jgi:restriction endonuclease Mrr
MESIETAILRIIFDHRSQVSTSQIYKALEAGGYFKLQEHHLTETIYGGRPAYQHEVRSYLSNMVQKGLVERLAWGVYGITELGKRKIWKCV